ncbi:MAG: M20 family metallopeptidase [Gammaproteobacteria bacterium]|nr:M20 family metallopeptidase [Gammaproteobacteria bacterium]
MANASGPLILDYLKHNRMEFVSVLELLTLCESPSDVPDTQKGIRVKLAEAFQDLGFKIVLVNGRTSGGHLYARPAKRTRRSAAQLMLGHYDTVWPVGTLKTMPLQVDGNVIKGPGVYDMKGGVVQMLFALKALREFGIEPPVTPLVFLNSDEEIGSRESRKQVLGLARCVERVFVLEPSLGSSGKLKTARKGVGRFTVLVKGRAAHAGLDPEGGVSAILEMSHVIQQLFAMNDVDRGVTVNVGTVDGGLRPNVVAPESRAVVDVRVKTLADAQRVEQAILNLTPTTSGVTLKIEGGIGRPPLEPTARNQRLWKLAQALGWELGLELDQGLAGGGSDGNLTSTHTATLDGLGAVGGGAHAPHEFLYIDKTLERAALLALLLAQPPVAVD